MRTLATMICVMAFKLCTAQPYKYLVMEGGGIRGITYAGAIKTLEEKNVLRDVERVAGTSVGALVAGLIAVGYNADELKMVLNELKLQQFNDGKGIFIGGMRRMNKNYGWYRGEAIEEWMGRLIAAKTGNSDLTLLQLHQLAEKDKRYKDLYAVATNLTLQRTEVLFYDAYPDMPVKTAIRASIAIPMYYGAIFIDSAGRAYKRQNKDHSRQILVDGGIVANYPLALFDTGGINPHTLGLKLERPEQIDYYNQTHGLAPYKITNFKSYVSALYNIMIEQLNKPNSTRGERRRTIYISTGNVNPRVRKISKTEKERLYENGRIAAEKFFNNN